MRALLALIVALAAIGCYHDKYDVNGPKKEEYYLPPDEPRYNLPDYARLLREGSAFLALPPARDLDEALAHLLIAYTQSVQKLYDDYTLTVPLPEVDLPVGDLQFDVRMKGCANCEVTSTSHKI